MGKDVIIACDFASKEQVMAFLDKFVDTKPFVKIGMELFYAEGPQIVKEIKARGHKIFLDLKLHDIPNTVKKSMSVLSNLDVDMTNLHAAGTVRQVDLQVLIEATVHPAVALFDKCFEKFRKLRGFLFLSCGLGCVLGYVPNFEFLIGIGDALQYAINTYHSFRDTPFFCRFLYCN